MQDCPDPKRVVDGRSDAAGAERRGGWRESPAARSFLAPLKGEIRDTDNVTFRTGPAHASEALEPIHARRQQVSGDGPAAAGAAWPCMRGDPAALRARHWARWRRSRLREYWERRAHLDLLGTRPAPPWVCSWQRSGSTLLAEVLASAPGTRLLYEPANVPGALFTGEAAAQVPLPTGPGPELRSIERALRGRVHGAWVDQLAERRTSSPGAS